jgi:uncharacterized protein (DUF736 family)
MPVIGTFSAVKDGYAGSIRTLMLNGRVRIGPTERKSGADAPDAWPQPVWRALLETTEDGVLRLIWRRTNGLSV